MIDFPSLYPSLVKYLPNWLDRFYPSIARFARGEGYPCGNKGVFIPRRNKCWTHPKTGQRMKKPLTYQMYQEAKAKSQKSRTERGRTALDNREQGFRDKARERVKGWQKNKTGEQNQQSKRPETHSDFIKITPEEQKLLDATPLKGSEKQVAWAEQLRKNSIIQAKLEASLYSELLTKDNPKGEKLSVNDFKEVSSLIGKYAATKQDAKFWIDRRYKSNQEDLIRPAMTTYVERLAENNDTRLTDELKEIALAGKKQRIVANQERKLLKEKYKNIQKPDLEGTERQVNWANKIRDGFLNDAQSQKLDPDSIQKALENEKLKDSKFWIENRDMSMQGHKLSYDGIKALEKTGKIKNLNAKDTREQHEIDWDEYLKAQKITKSQYRDLSPEQQKEHRDKFRKIPIKNEIGLSANINLAQFTKNPQRITKQIRRKHGN